MTLKVRRLQCLEEKDNSIILFGYGSALGEAHSKKMCQEALAKALTEKLGKKTPTPQIAVLLAYPPHDGYKPYKKGGPRPEYNHKMKRGLQVRYDASQEELIKGGLPAVEEGVAQEDRPTRLSERVPGDNTGTTTSKRFKENCIVHLAPQCCARTGTLTGVAYLDVPLGFSTKKDGNHVSVEMRSLKDVLMDVDVGGKLLIGVHSRQREEQHIVGDIRDQRRKERGPLKYLPVYRNVDNVYTAIQVRGGGRHEELV